MSTASTLPEVNEYLHRGWAPIPIPRGQKAPALKNWSHLRLGPDDLSAHFGSGQNIGILLGDPSGGLIDVDLDTPEAIALAPAFLPETAAVFGRSSKPASHWLYVSKGPTRTSRFRDEKGSVVVEVRSTGSQTVFPPSQHSGETVQWYKAGEPADINHEILRAAVRHLAAGAVLASHWPVHGSRQDAALALAGGLARNGWPPEKTAQFLSAVAMIAGDEETAKRVTAAYLTQRRLAAGDPATGWPRLAEIIGEPPVNTLLKWLYGKQRSADRGDSLYPAGNESGGSAGSQAQTLVSISLDSEVFHTPDCEAYASIHVNGHIETWPVRSKGFKDWLMHAFYSRERKPAGNQALQDALAQIEAQARFDGAEHPVFLRIAQIGATLYLDLCNEAWEVVKVTASGWEIVPDPNVRFRRSKGMMPLPTPKAGGSVELLRPYVNAADERIWVLLVAFLVGAFRPAGPYPVLILEGEAGSAKSTVSKLIRMLVDPSTPVLRAPPREERDLVIGAHNNWLLAFDNLSPLPASLSDALCRLATGGGFATRELYRDLDEVIFDATRPVILNGIDDPASRADLSDRGSVVSLKPIPDESRRPEAELLRSFDRDRPLILGALLDAVSRALRDQDSIRLNGYPRMADHARWVSAAEPALNWPTGTFLEMDQEQRQDTAAAGLEADEVAGRLVEFLSEFAEYRGTATELLGELNRRVPESCRGRAWPKSARTLASRVRRAAPYLRNSGIEIDECKESRTRRRLFVFRQRPQNIVPTVPIVLSPAESSSFGGDDREYAPGQASLNSSPHGALTDNELTDGDDGDGGKPSLSNECVMELEGRE
jgi:Bifunctional DNA primase/polymerase, N-terminal